MPKKHLSLSIVFLWYFLLPSALCLAQSEGEKYTFTDDIASSGGFFDSLMAGSAVGTLFGHSFTGFGILDVAVAAIALYIMFKLILFYGLSSRDDSHHRLDTGQLPDEEDPKKAIKMQALNAWARLRSESAEEDPLSKGHGHQSFSAPNQQKSIDNFDREDFLDGAKLLYTRLQKAWAARKIDQLQDFITPAMLEVLTAHAKDNPQTSSIEVVLVTPTLIEVTPIEGSNQSGPQKSQTGNITDGSDRSSQPEEENGIQAKVLFTALISEGDAQHPVETKEIWYFVFDPSQQTTWQLDGIEPVTNTTV